jgi:hypothetical protein
VTLSIAITTYLLGLVTCIALALSHPESWPYTAGGYRPQMRRMLRRFWARVALIAVLWPVFVIGWGLVAVGEELT